ncbi:DUF1329 domain-containing protein [Sinimarinibacterium sp. NLF-5-8]|uniref:DUF1329 domain-containing protein n=1 Tax=Sinimarinibacterium sp. NLF-5-8 TaxID=2698684 RepID=UPI00137B9FAD|nr:DUF1329 domain-containing protein [Sinimarinibacterium sp. NLF-5-8]QHS11101.1 DUF1329 domain-containing protein [Sinimarinibacterium sp. NLF-5-8]
MYKKSIVVLALMASVGIAQAAADADVELSFNPYKNGVPTFPGLTAGVVVNQSNADQFKEALDEAQYQAVKNGWTEMTVGATTAFEVDTHYVEATRANVGKAALGEKNGEIVGYVAGRPFPEEPSIEDPRAGEKVAWNYKYGINWGDGAAIYPFYWKYRNLESGQVERTIKFNFHFLNFKHRVQHDPVPEILPNPSELFRGIYVKVLAPQDLKDTQLLIQRYENDLKFDDAYLYLGFQRRVRRLATGQTTDAFLGADLMIEDFEGYNGRVSDMQWTYKGTKNILMPFYNHNDLSLTDEYKESDGYQYVDFGGQGGCYPNITWQLRKVYVLEAVPVNKGHPISKRVFHIDAQFYTINRTLIYDRKGELWKSWTIGKSHPDHHLPINKGTGIAIDDSFSIVDVQARHCTTGQFKGQVDPKLNPPSLFQVQNMRGSN